LLVVGQKKILINSRINLRNTRLAKTYHHYHKKITSSKNNSYHLFCDPIEDVKNAAMDVKKYKNYTQNHQKWDHKYTSVLHLNPLNSLDV
jgi:hypothetical protein